MHNNFWILGLIVIAIAASIATVGRSYRARRIASGLSTPVSTKQAIIVASVSVGVLVLPLAVLGTVVVAFFLSSL